MGRKKDKPHIKYFNMGPWPVYIGFTMNEEDFAKEMARLCPGQDVAFLGTDQAGATCHILTNAGTLTAIITIHEPSKAIQPELYASMIAHEVVHALQATRDHLVNSDHGSEGMGTEGEAYFVQYLVQGMLQIAWDTGRTNRTEPTKEKAS